MSKLKKESGITRYEYLPLPVKAIFVVMTCCGILLATLYIFSINVFGEPIQQWTYYYLVIALFGSSAFLLIPRKKGLENLPWYDIIAAVLMLSICVYFSTNAKVITYGKWINPKGEVFILALVVVLLVLEIGRRVAGTFFVSLCLLLVLYPLVADNFSGLFYGRGFTFRKVVGNLLFANSGIVGIPTGVMANMLIGFLLFAGFLLASGAGAFFLKMALVLLGKFRGGPAKVAIISSCFFGSLSGSAIANIVATGSFTIPMMKKQGYPPHYAGAIETVASMGGGLMPPVMGANAFVMAQLLGVEYSLVVLSAIVPALLYYFGLIMQVDAYASKVEMVGLPKEEIPSFKETFMEGWHFLFVLAFLVFGLLYMRWEAKTPFYATVLLIILSTLRKETRLGIKGLINTVATTGTLVTQTSSVILPIGFILNGLMITGLSGSFASGIISIGADNLVLVMILGIAACYIMGMAGLVVVSYILLAITLAPALIKLAGFNEIAVHLFLIYYANMGSITPPVAVASFVGAAVAKADPMKTAVKSMTLGIVMYFVPFFFLFNPSLIFQGDLYRTLYLVPMCVLGISLIAASLEGVLIFVGKIPIWLRPVIGLSGFAISYPGLYTTIGGFGVAIISILFIILTNRTHSSQNFSAP